jgi:hypothetical protein
MQKCMSHFVYLTIIAVGIQIVVAAPSSPVDNLFRGMPSMNVNVLKKALFFIMNTAFQNALTFL